MRKLYRALPLAVPLLLTACVTVPQGPSVAALPGSGKAWDQFRADDVECRQYAAYQSGDPVAAANNSGVASAALGTALGAALGAAVDGSHGAGIGAATGLLFGSAAGAGAAQTSAYHVQRRYDVGYTQCMYAKGNKVPVNEAYAPRAAAQPQPHYNSGYSPVPPDYYPR
jgi:outer membrane lipoprotein SlyB